MFNSFCSYSVLLVKKIFHVQAEAPSNLCYGTLQKTSDDSKTELHYQSKTNEKDVARLHCFHSQFSP